MIDIKLIRENPEIVKENIKKKFQNNKIHLVDKIIEIDESWRNLKAKADLLRHERNTISKEISEAKKTKNEAKASALLKTAKKIPEEIEKTEEKTNKLEEERNLLLSQIPNIINKNVPIGKDSTKNVEDKKFEKIPKFKFTPKNHVELGESLNILDFDNSAKTSGKGFYYLKDDLALLNQAIIRYGIDFMTKKGYSYIETPLMLRSSVMNNVTDLNDQKNQIYKIENEDLYLIGTSEHSLIGRFIDTTIQESMLPIKNTSYSMCFRKEIGSHGIEEKGIFRTHQFNKIEMISICKPNDSMKIFEEMKKITIDLFKSMKIPIRVLKICSGDLGDLKHIQVDIEAWSPVKKEYYEVGSCSNLTDAQARKLKIRAIGKKGEKYTPHTLNNTAVATSRALVAILENNQTKAGEIKIPKVLQKYMNNKKIIQSKKQEKPKKSKKKK